MAKNRRAQTPKPITAGRNEKFNEAMREIGRSNSARPHRSARDYSRSVKHRNRQFADSY